jgi:cytochrome c biogenesis protein
MQKLLKTIFDFSSSITFTLIILGGIVFFTGLPLVAGKFAEAYNDWPWLQKVSSLEFYGSKIIIILLALFSFNLLACSLKHLQRTLRFLKNTAALPDGDSLQALTVSEILMPGNPADIFIRAAQALGRCFTKPRIINAGESPYLYAEKGRLTHFGFYLAHLSMLTLVIGIMVATQGYHYALDVARGQVIDPLTVVDNKGKVIKLDFGLRCDDFSVSYYEGGREIKEISCTLSLLAGGTQRRSQTIDFSRALSHRGFDIFQNRTVSVRQRARIAVTAPDGQTHMYEKQTGESITLPGTQLSVRAVSFRQGSLQLISLSTPGRLWISKAPARFPDTALQGFTFRLEELADTETTSLKIIYDPAKKIVWCSFLAMIVGFFAMFFLSHLRMWITTEPREEGCLITIAGASSREMKPLRDAAERIRAELGANT